MENVSTDTDADPRSTVGVGQVESLGKALHEIQPSWLQDGHGIRGPQRPQAEQVSARPESMEFGIPTGKRASEPSDRGGLTVTDGTTTVTAVTKISFEGSVFEIVDSGNGEAHVQCAT